jgi:dUTP pyrophosphatase
MQKKNAEQPYIHGPAIPDKVGVMKLLWAGLKKGAKVSAPHYAGDLGFDMTITEDVILAPDRVTNVPCSLRLALPDGYGALVIGRSSLARRGVHVYATLIDQAYHGDMFVLAQCIGAESITLQAGERVAQLLLVQVPPRIEVIEVGIDELPISDRGTNGFGSTGK